MADNVPITPGSGATVSTEEVTTLNGASVTAQHLQRVAAGLRTADGTAIDLPGDASNGLDVDVTRVQGTVAVSDGGGTLSIDDGAGSLTVDGTVAVSGVSGTVAVSGPLTDAQLRASAVPVSDNGGSLTVDGTVAVSGTVPVTDNGGSLTVDGTVTANPDTASSATVTAVASSASNVTLAASNTGRKALYVFNDSTAVLYLKFGATATTSSYTVQIPAGGFWEMPTRPVYTGIVDGIWASANGNARITEL